MIMGKSITIGLMALWLSSCAIEPKYGLVIQNVGLFDGEKDQGVVNIAINADIIAAISKERLLSDSLVDAKGKYMIPGLVNSHVHMWMEEHLKEAYRTGILANMGMHASDPSRDRALKALGEREGYPYYYSSGIGATVPGGHPTFITPGIETINDSVSIRQFVDNRILEGVDHIKIIRESTPWFEQPQGPPTLPFDSIAKIIAYAHSKGLKAVVHIGALEEMVQIAKLKPDGIVHMWHSSLDADLTQDRLRQIKESGAFVVPTALVNQRALMLAREQGEAFAKFAGENFLPMEKIKKSIGQLHDAGVTILAGTDNGNYDLNWGDDLIEELIIYSDSGMNNVEVLKTATGNPAKAWNIPVGSLHVGSKASMLLLNGNPLDDLEHLRDIHTIWKNGAVSTKDSQINAL